MDQIWFALDQSNGKISAECPRSMSECANEWKRLPSVEETKKIDEVWVDEETGLLCLMRKTEFGSLCGYVGIDRTHPWAGKEYGDCLLPTAKPRGEKPSDREPMFPHSPLKMSERMIKDLAKKLICDEDYCGHTVESMIEVHGGVTFAGEWEEFGGSDIWWFGFDCAHYMDLVPGLASGLSIANHGTFKDENFVTREIEAMAKQIKRKGDQWPCKS